MLTPYVSLTACGKMRYGSRSAAQRAMHQQELRTGREDLQIYTCRICQVWHVGGKAFLSERSH